jgi:peptidyl-dipeptidase Dcp
VLHAQNNSVKTLFYKKSTLQYQAPPFNLIKDKDFKPAFEYGLGVHNKEVMAIAKILQNLVFKIRY